MKVRLKIYSTLREALGTGTLEVSVDEDSDIEELIRGLQRSHGRKFKRIVGREMGEELEKRFNIFLNGNMLRLPRDYNIKLRDRDELVILRPVGGGLHQ